ncbi:MAG: PDZ domain-containing protein [Calditrichales bacterium]|nr:MAG: PDZ domain-containing protein [Calditrichales bacterium]
MMRYFPPFVLSLLFSVSSLFSAGLSPWPEELQNLKSSVCLVEFFQPQFELGEITDKSRIKRNITGVLVNDQGLVMTSDVIYPANLDITESNSFFLSNQPKPENITVSFIKNKKLKAQFVGKDEELRIAFIQILEPDSLPKAAPFTADKICRIGDPLYLIQHLTEQFDYEPIITDHHINAIIEKPIRKFILSTSFEPLSAGGLAVDTQGHAVGIVYRSKVDYPSYDYGYEISASGASLQQVIPATRLIPLIKAPPLLPSGDEGSGKSWLGVQMQILTKEMARYWDLENTSGIILNKVMPGSPAAVADLRVGDILISFDQLQINGYDKKNLDILRAWVRGLPEGHYKSKILRDKKLMEVDIPLQSAPKSRFLAEEYSNEFLGLSVKEITQDYLINNELDFSTEGVWVSRVEDAGISSLGDLEANDLILRLNNRNISDLDSFRQEVDSLMTAKVPYIQIFIKRDGKTRFLYVKTMFGENK